MEKIHSDRLYNINISCVPDHLSLTKLRSELHLCTGHMLQVESLVNKWASEEM